MPYWLIIVLIVMLVYIAQGAEYAGKMSMRKEKRSACWKMVIAWLPAFFIKPVARWIYK